MMKFKSVLIALFLLGGSHFLFAQLSVSAIPDSLKNGADAVIRYADTKFEVLAKDKGVFSVSYAVTILNEQGEGHNFIAVHYDRSMLKIRQIKGTLYDASGNEISKLKKVDILDRSSVSSGSLYEDDRMKIARLAADSYPYTVHFYYEVEYNGLFNYPDWSPVAFQSLAVQGSSLEVVMPASLPLRYKMFNIDEPVKKTIEGNKHYSWKVANIKGAKPEDYSMGLGDFMPKVLLAPSEFAIEGYAGNMNSWKDFGEFRAQLLEGKQDLDEEAKKEVLALTAGVEDDKEKARIIYNYLQNRTRYVSVQLGLGGWQPYPASYVHKNGYGDCKALTNYTKSLLDVVGVESYYTLVKAGDFAAPIYPDFPSNQFNHVILCIPNEKEPVWLECTSQTQPFGFLGSFTADRDVLMLTPEGGKLAHTPVYDESMNIQSRNIQLKVNGDGTATASISSVYYAEQQDGLHQLLTKSEEDQKKWLYKHFDFSSFDINSWSFNWEKENANPSFEIKADVGLRKYASKGGKRLFLKPNVLTRWSFVPEVTEERKSDIYIKSSFTDIDTVVIELPENYRADYIPKATVIETRFGKYESTFIEEGNKVIYIRKMIRPKGVYDKKYYEELINFYKKIVKADKAKIVIVDKT